MMQAIVHRRLPTNAFSHFVGLVSEVNIPWFLRRAILGCYAWLTNCNMEEAIKSNLTEYATLSQLFQRELKPECRQIDHTAAMVSYLGMIVSL